MKTRKCGDNDRKKETAIRKASMGKGVMLALAMSAALPMGTMLPMRMMRSYAADLFGAVTRGREAAAEAGYVFQSGGTLIQMGAEAAPVLAALGQTVKPVFEQDSCAYQGKDKVYTYVGFELSTYQKNGKEYIASVYFTDPVAVTPEGIKISSSAADVLKAYGVVQEEMGVYRYIRGNSELSIFTTNGVVDAIEYIVLQA